MPHHIRRLLFVSFFLATACKQVPNLTDHPLRADSILGTADKLLNGTEINKAFKYVDSAYQAFDEAGPIDLWKKYNFQANFFLNYQYDTLKASLYTDSMVLVLKNREEVNKVEYANTLFAQGELLVAKRKYTEAFDYYYKGLVFARKNMDSCRLAPFNAQLGKVRYKQGKYLKAVPFLKQAFRENSQCPESSSFYERFIQPQSMLNTIALCYEKGDVPDSAIVYYHKALNFINEQAYLYKDDTAYGSTARGVVLGNLGGVYAKLNKFKESVSYLSESIRINNRTGYAISDAQTAILKLADVYIKHSRFPQAGQLLNELEAYLAQFDGKNKEYDDIRLKWYRLKWMYYDSTGVTNQAYDYIRHYYNLKDSIAAASQGLSAADMDDGFRHSEELFKLELLKKEDQLKTISLLALVLVLLMAVIILWIVWRHLTRSRKANREISIQNEHLQLALNALEQSQADNTRMMKVVAHDLRSPVGAITSLAALLLDYSELNEDDRMMVELIKTSGQNSLDMVGDMLQANTHAETLNKEPVDLQQMLHYCVDVLQHKATAKKQEIHLLATPVTIMASREKIWRVVSNLIGNAIKFSATGTVITVRMKMVSEEVLISVEDRGIGIPDNLKEKIFDMFSKDRRYGTEGEQPFGLGLAISKQIVEAHGGSIWFEARAGGGTTFFVQLPA